MAAAFACFAYLYFFDDRQLFLMYQCWRQAVNISACCGEKSFDFTADLNGERCQGNTGNYIDGNIFYYEPYEKPVLFFLRDIRPRRRGRPGLKTHRVTEN